jgi:poly(A) polymerase
MNYKSSLTEKVFGYVSQAAEELGYEAYVVGGWVRDLILKRDSKDIDFVCVGSGIELAKKVAQIAGK